MCGQSLHILKEIVLSDPVVVQLDSSQKQLCISPMQNIRVLSKVQKDSGPCTDTDFAIYSAQRSHTKLSALGVMQ